MRILYLLAAISLFTACNNKADIPTTENTALQVSEPIPFAGCWVNEEYYDSLVLYKSLTRAQHRSTYMEIPDSTLKPFGIVFNFHEGISDLIVVKNNEHYEIHFKSADTLINHGPIEILAASKIKFGETTYVKVNTKRGDDETKIVEALLFKGVYTNNKAETIEFKSDGILTGFTGYESYELSLDYFDASRQEDLVALQKTNSKTPRLMGFKFKRDTLELYQLKCVTEKQSECIEVDFEGLKYRLWKQ